MKDIYKKPNKNSLMYKIRSWIIISSSIMELLHFTFLLIKTKNIAFLIIIMIISFCTIMDMYDGFSIGRFDPLVTQIIGLAGSYVFMYSLLDIEKLITLVFVEVFLIFIGLLIRVLIYYKGHPEPQWKRRLKNSKRNKRC